MFKLHLKIAYRYLLKNPMFSFINIVGLAIGMASFILIMFYVNYERSFDRFEGSENVYRLYMDYLEGEEFAAGDAQTYNSTGPTFKAEFPEIEDFVRLRQAETVSFVQGEKIIQESMGYLADASFFDIFNYRLLKGESSTALANPYSIVLSESMANKLFGEEDPIGRTISIFRRSSEALVTVTAIMQDIRENSHLKAEYLISYNTMKTWDSFNHYELNWSRNNFFTYVQVVAGTDFKTLKEKVMAVDFEDDEDERHNIESISSIHLHSNKPYEAETNGSESRVKYLNMIAFLILILSWANYINLSTAKSLERAKEVGVRKVAGAQRNQLIAQSILESVLISILAMLVAFGVISLVLPIYSDYLGTQVKFSLEDLRGALPIFMYILVAVLLSALYPAILLSSYTPVQALKGKVRATSQGLNLRRVLIIAQFVVTIVLVVGTIVINLQISFMRNQPVGVEFEQVLAIEGDVLSSRADSLLRKDYLTVIEELKKLPQVRAASSSSTYPGDSYENLSSFQGLTRPDGVEDGTTVFYNAMVGAGYFDVIGHELLAGKEFTNFRISQGVPNQIIINEAWAMRMGYADPREAFGKQLKFWGMDFMIQAVITNYHHFGLKNKVEPQGFLANPVNELILIKLDQSVLATSSLDQALLDIEATWKRIFPQSTFDYTMVDSNFDQLYSEDRKFSAAITLFTILAIFIAALGLFGLTSYACVQRRKEIGIRRVNGASILSILKLLNIEFLKWIGIAFLIAAPLAWYLMNSWLETFAVHTELEWWVFIIAALAIVLVTLITVSWQSYAAASANPVKALKDE